MLMPNRTIGGAPFARRRCLPPPSVVDKRAIELHACAMPNHPQVDALLDALVAAGRPSSRSLPLAEGRRNFADLFGSFAATEEVEGTEDLQIAGASGATILARLYRPLAHGMHEAAAPADRPLIAFFHGGGWVFGTVDTHDGVCRAVANAAGTVVASIGFRPAPEHPFPAPLDDAVEAIRWLFERGRSWGDGNGRLAVAGDSSGGNLAAAAALRLRDEGGPPLDAQILLYPLLDPTMSSASIEEHADDPFLSKDEVAWYWDQYVGPNQEARWDPYAAPSRAADLSGLPPALVVTAENDPLRDEGESYARRLMESGVVTTAVRVPGMVHGFVSMGGVLGEARATMLLVGRYLAAALAWR
jgi:acetyl esterase